LTKTEIEEAAFRVWGRNFYRKTSLSQLAKELGVSKPALYRHFASKQALTLAMTQRFLDNFADFIRADFEKARQIKDTDDGIYLIIGSVTEYFARNVYSLIFSITNIYEQNLDAYSISEQLKSRGVDISILQHIIEKKYKVDEKIVRLVFAVLTFLMSYYHKIKNSFDYSPTDEDIKNITDLINSTIKNGLNLPAQKVSIDFEDLEKKIDKMALNAKPEPFFKAVAEAVAQAGPWDVSMEMVAKKLGLSKSSLYGHFKNKKDMLRRLFATEFRRIIEYARQGISLSEKPEEQLYLGIFSIAVYLRSRPEILVAMNWFRTRKIDLGKPDKNIEIFRLFEDVKIESFYDITENDKQRISHLICFLLINILVHPTQLFSAKREKMIKSVNLKVQNNDIRELYKFITQGLGGFYAMRKKHYITCNRNNTKCGFACCLDSASSTSKEGVNL
jgi:AcrR family transcriptional regulator